MTLAESKKDERENILQNHTITKELKEAALRGLDLAMLETKRTEAPELTAETLVNAVSDLMHFARVSMIEGPQTMLLRAEGQFQEECMGFRVRG